MSVILPFLSGLFSFNFSPRSVSPSLLSFLFCPIYFPFISFPFLSPFIGLSLSFSFLLFFSFPTPFKLLSFLFHFLSFLFSLILSLSFSFHSLSFLLLSLSICSSSSFFIFLVFFLFYFCLSFPFLSNFSFSLLFSLSPSFQLSQNFFSYYLHPLHLLFFYYSPSLLFTFYRLRVPFHNTLLSLFLPLFHTPSLSFLTSSFLLSFLILLSFPFTPPS